MKAPFQTQMKIILFYPISPSNQNHNNHKRFHVIAFFNVGFDRGLECRIFLIYFYEISIKCD